MASNTDETKETYFWMGAETFKVPMSMHAEQRQRLLARMEKVAPKAGVVLLKGAVATTRDDTDHEPLIRQESFFQYLFGVKEPDCYAAISLATGHSHLFVPRLPRSYQVWMGRIITTDEFKEMYAVDFVHYTDELVQVLEKETGEGRVVHTLGTEVNTDSGNVHAGAPFAGEEAFKINRDILSHELIECRVIKTPKEIELMRYVCSMSSDAHRHVMLTAKPEMMEYQLEANFRHFAYYNGGARHCGYTCICAAGNQGATLHYGHAGAPNNMNVKPNNMLLLDMGAEYHCYGADITRTFPSDGKYSEEQRNIYNAVLASQKAVFDAIKPGVPYTDMHRLAEKVILEHLLRIGLVKGSLEDLVSNHIANIFMPHGLGHMLGLDTHDVGGYEKGTSRIQEPGLRSLRCGRKLEAGMVITVEPGIYFNWPELEQHFQDSAKSKFLVQEEINKYMGFGGVRIEDDVLVTATGMENLTTVPATVEEVEAILAQNPFIKAHHAKSA